MSTLDLDHHKNYEWIGTFWMPNKPGKEFSGKLSYSPETGIQISVFNTDAKPLVNKSLRIMHGIIRHGEETVPITLFEVFLQRSGISMHLVFSEFVTGSARAIVFGDLLKNFIISGLYIDYDDNFYQFLSTNKNISSMVKFAQIPVVIGKTQISLEIVNATAHTIYSADDFDDIICSFSAESNNIINSFKKHIQPFLDENKYNLLKRLHTNIAIHIKSGYNKFSIYRMLEHKLRLFLEFLIDCKIGINFSWIDVVKHDRNDKIYHKAYPMLCRDFAYSSVHNHKKLSHVFMPITIKDFVINKDNNLLNTSINRWLSVYDEPGWHNLITGIEDMLNEHQSIIGQKDYVMLISYIETLQNLRGKPKNNDIDGFVSENLSTSWKTKIKRILKYSQKQDKNLGNALCEIRNVIVHPKSHKKNNGKYYAIANNELALQNVYGILAGAFINGVMNDIYSIPKEIINKHINAFIQTHSSYKYIKYAKC